MKVRGRSEKPSAVARWHRPGVNEQVFRSLTSSGPGDAVFVLLHGIGMSHRYFARLHQQLFAHGTVVSVDLPGFGGLPKPVHDLDVTEMADALGEVLDALSIDSAVLIGHSMGAQWVVELAVRRPELASEVVVIGPVVDDRHRTVMAQARALALDTLREPPLANLLVFADYLRCGPRWYLTQLRHMMRYRIQERAALLRSPLLVVRGAADPVAGRRWCRRLRDAASRAALVEIPNRVHNCQQSAPRVVADAILHAGWAPAADAAVG